MRNAIMNNVNMLLSVYKTIEEQMMEDFLVELSECDKLIASRDDTLKARGISRKAVITESIRQLKSIQQLPLNERSNIKTGGYSSEELERFQKCNT